DDDIPDPDYEPTRINGQIRKLLAAFSRSAYVGYTATPFANILIHEAAVANEFGDDLFPRSFIINLPAPSNYVGPDLVFGSEVDDKDDDPLPLIRKVDQDGEGWIAQGHKKTFTPRYQDEDRIPPSLEDAILSFVLSCAARAARGKPNAHNSMLVHVSRFKNVHQKVYSQVNDWLSNLKRFLKYKTGGEDLRNRLRAIWDNDFVPTSRTIGSRDIGQDVPQTMWTEIEPFLSAAAEKIRLQVMNSDLRDAIDYDGNNGTGVSI